MDQDINVIMETIFANTKLYIKEQLQGIDPMFHDLNDIKCNLATLSSLLSAKGLFSEEEYHKTFEIIKDSFGVVKNDGSMDGSVNFFRYNF